MNLLKGAVLASFLVASAGACGSSGGGEPSCEDYVETIASALPGDEGDEMREGFKEASEEEIAAFCDDILTAEMRECLDQSDESGLELLVECGFAGAAE